MELMWAWVWCGCGGVVWCGGVGWGGVWWGVVWWCGVGVVWCGVVVWCGCGEQEAYEVLSDAQERAWYDSHREAILR